MGRWALAGCRPVIIERDTRQGDRQDVRETPPQGHGYLPALCVRSSLPESRRHLDEKWLRRSTLARGLPGPLKEWLSEVRQVISLHTDWAFAAHRPAASHSGENADSSGEPLPGQPCGP